MCKKEKGNKSGQLETIQCFKFIHMWDRMILNAGIGKFIGGLLFMASLMYGFLIYIILSGFYSNRPVLTSFLPTLFVLLKKKAEVIKFWGFYNTV